MSLKLYSNETSRLGSELFPADRAYVLAAYCHRFTGNHRPAWASQPWKADGTPYPLQFASDAEWLANTRFAVGAHGDLDRRSKECLSSPTWPNNPELRKQRDLVGAGPDSLLESERGTFQQARLDP